MDRSTDTESATFTEAEIEYLRSQPLGRLATVDAHGRPAVRPVGFFFDPLTDAVVIGGWRMSASKKYRDAQDRPDVSLVVDDLASVDPRIPRGIEVRGRAETHDEGGAEVGARVGADFGFDAAWILLRPRRILAWGIDTGTYEMWARDAAEPVGGPR